MDASARRRLARAGLWALRVCAPIRADVLGSLDYCCVSPRRLKRGVLDRYIEEENLDVKSNATVEMLQSIPSALQPPPLSISLTTCPTTPHYIPQYPLVFNPLFLPSLILSISPAIVQSSKTCPGGTFVFSNPSPSFTTSSYFSLA